MKLHMEMLPEAQLSLWPELKNIPKNFILYGGTAIALQLGHRESIDFDFFSDSPLNKDLLLNQCPFLNNAEMTLSDAYTMDGFISMPQGKVKLQFLTDLAKRQGRINKPFTSDDNQLLIASLDDLFATKLNTVQLRAEKKDYLDIHALLQHGLSLEYGLGCAKAVYGFKFDPATSLRALCSYRDGDLEELDSKIKQYLKNRAMKIQDIPEVVPLQKPTLG